MDLDLHSQKCLSHDLINIISNKNASAVTSVVQHLQFCDIFYQKYMYIPNQFDHWSLNKKVTTLVALGGTVALLNYFGKADEEKSLKIILAMIWKKLRVIVHWKNNILPDYQLENFIYIQGERWLSQPFLGSGKPSSPANKAFMFPFILKLQEIISLWKQLQKQKCSHVMNLTLWIMYFLHVAQNIKMWSNNFFLSDTESMTLFYAHY